LHRPGVPAKRFLILAKTEAKMGVVARPMGTLAAMKAAIDGAPRNAYIAELHLQIIKYARELQSLTGREFCEAIAIPQSFGTEFLKMRKIAPRLRAAGLDPSKI
jgi:hypothetical protein